MKVKKEAIRPSLPKMKQSVAIKPRLRPSLKLFETKSVKPVSTQKVSSNSKKIGVNKKKLLLALENTNLGLAQTSKMKNRDNVLINVKPNLKTKSSLTVQGNLKVKHKNASVTNTRPNSTTASSNQVKLNLESSKSALSRNQSRRSSKRNRRPEKKVKPQSKVHGNHILKLQKLLSSNLMSKVKQKNNGPKLQLSKVLEAARNLLNVVRAELKTKPGLLDLEGPIFMQVECIKIPVCNTKQLRFKLPHPLVNESSDILLITADKKGAKNQPVKAVEYYSELLENNNIHFIKSVMPIRQIRQEYSQFELKRKLVDQFDLILADATITKSLSKPLGKFVMFKRKMPIPVHLNRANLKEHLQTSISKTQMTVKSNGHSSTVQVGHTKMTEAELAANIVAVGESLSQLFPGGWNNIRSLTIKDATSVALPVYISLVSANRVKVPAEQRRQKQDVEDELSTYPDFNVIVKEDGTVTLKKLKTNTKTDDHAHDEEILKEAEKYLQSSKTVRYNDSSDDDEDKNDSDKSGDDDDDDDGVTAAMEKQLLNRYNKMKGNDNRESEPEDEEESDDEVAPPTFGKKRKKEITKTQKNKVSPNKKQKKMQNQPKSSLKEKKSAPKDRTIGKSQTRGTRGGKKNKISKDQRKAMIKRNKAGKK